MRTKRFQNRDTQRRGRFQRISAGLARLLESGATEDEALANARDAIRKYLDARDDLLKVSGGCRHRILFDFAGDLTVGVERRTARRLSRSVPGALSMFNTHERNEDSPDVAVPARLLLLGRAHGHES